MLSLAQGSVDGSLALGFVEAGLVEDFMDEDVTFLRLLSLQVTLVYHALNGLLLPSLLLLLRLSLILLLLALLTFERVLSPISTLLLEDVHSFLHSDLGEGFFLLDLTEFLTNIPILIGVDHLLPSLRPLPLPSSVLLRISLSFLGLLLLFALLGWFFLCRLLSDILIPKINKITLVTLLRFL